VIFIGETLTVYRMAVKDNPWRDEESSTRCVEDTHIPYKFFNDLP